MKSSGGQKESVEVPQKCVWVCDVSGAVLCESSLRDVPGSCADRIAEAAALQKTPLPHAACARFWLTELTLQADWRSNP